MKVDKLSQLLTEKFKTFKSYSNRIMEINTYLELRYEDEEFQTQYKPNIVTDYQRLTHISFVKTYQTAFSIPKFKQTSFDNTGYAVGIIELTYLFMIHFKDKTIANLVFSCPRNTRESSEFLSGYAQNSKSGYADDLISEIDDGELVIFLDDLLTFKKRKEIQYPKTTKPKVDIE